MQTLGLTLFVLDLFALLGYVQYRNFHVVNRETQEATRDNHVEDLNFGHLVQLECHILWYMENNGSFLAQTLDQ